ncbi:MAG: acetyl-CoA carboxylase carboxyltransferase subunit alpha [Elusimicrobia bacterium RIFOXYD2_FULL_34_15]|nr:MAG: acetyl-CoA carboxylase carboxyltransferase subunit alpha [Elusimicrobia bacterium RIFOXYD2_FULL_34_15]
MPEETLIALEFEKPIAELENKIFELKSVSKEHKQDFSTEIKTLEEKCEKLKTEIFSNLTSWQKVQLARHPQRPHTLEIINFLMTDFTELHGDRHFADDKAIVCGFAKFNGEPVAVIGHEKGKTTEERIYRNFGQPNPEGYRKALRIFKLAEKFKIPIITFIDTAGAYPGIGPEERGQSEAIARNLFEMSLLRIPIIACVIGEGGSGGALAISVSDRILMLENAIYSVISPEGCSAILLKNDSSRIPEIADSLKLTAQDLKKSDITEEIIKEPLGGAHRNVEETIKNINSVISKHLAELKKMPVEEMLEKRYKKYRKIGEFKVIKKGKK